VKREEFQLMAINGCEVLVMNWNECVGRELTIIDSCLIGSLLIWDELIMFIGRLVRLWMAS